MKEIKLEKDPILSGEKVDVVNVNFSMIPNFRKNLKRVSNEIMKDNSIMTFSNVIFLEH